MSVHTSRSRSGHEHGRNKEPQGEEALRSLLVKRAVVRVMNATAHFSIDVASREQVVEHKAPAYAAPTTAPISTVVNRPPAVYEQAVPVAPAVPAPEVDRIAAALSDAHAYAVSAAETQATIAVPPAPVSVYPEIQR